MLYLEDFLEGIENLPMEMRERFTDMRESDLEVHNTTDKLDEKTKVFFKKCLQPNVKKDWKDEQFSKIKDEYKKAIDNADEKVQIASQIYDMVDRHLRKLDIELNKFKMELEADNAGITELLEKRSLELDNVPKENNPPREKRKYTHHHHSEKRHATTAARIPTTITHETVHRHESYDYNDSNSPHTMHSAAASHASNATSAAGGSSSSTAVSYSVGKLGAHTNAALQAAASQALAATQHNMQQGRRSTMSLKASLEAVSKHSEQWPTLSESLSSTTSLTSESHSQSSRSQRVKKHTQKGEELIKAQKAKKHHHQQQHQTVHITPSAGADNEIMDVVDDGQVTGEWQYDPNEPRYCLCNQVSYGEMVGCDNNDCPIEWFHYGCVGLTSAPKGKWYCPQCQASMKRRGRK